ncbi:MAG: hypothetical protein LBK03_08930 [Bacteroidales bacterium]|nr:hypothetical protein [Bacteroidales bacterium]
MITVKEVKNRCDLKHFIRFPKQLYQNNPFFVPSLEREDWHTLTQHPARTFCDIRLWLAYKDGQLAGRIAGIINRRCNELKGQSRIRFGWFDVIDDFEVAQMLFKEVETWGRSQQLTEVSGPSRFSNMDKQGMLVWGFEHDVQPIFTEYNAPYYVDFVEKMGYVKEVDYLQYKIKVNKVPERVQQLSNAIMQRNKVKIKEFKNKRELAGYFRNFFEALNESYRNIYNFIPLTSPEIEYLIKGNLSLVRKELICVLMDECDRIIGFSLSIPSLSRAFQKAGGKLFPFGWYSVLKAFRHSKLLNLVLTGVLPEWRTKGIHALYHNKLNEIYLQQGFKYAISNPQLEENVATRVWQKYDSELIFRRRCFCKKLAEM